MCYGLLQQVERTLAFLEVKVYVNHISINVICHRSYYVISRIDTFAMWRAREEGVVVVMKNLRYVVDVNIKVNVIYHTMSYQ